VSVASITLIILLHISQHPNEAEAVEAEVVKEAEAVKEAETAVEVVEPVKVETLTKMVFSMTTGIIPTTLLSLKGLRLATDVIFLATSTVPVTSESPVSIKSLVI
jgi:hypothetical protein